MKKLIPLFPLNLVVFPGSKYPLHIFEPRYKKMIAECLEANTGFGIVAQVGTEISNIGSYVTITTVLKKYESGEMDIIVQGLNRFMLDKIDLHEDGYYTAYVKDYRDNEFVLDNNLLSETSSSFRHLLERVNIELEQSFWNNLENIENKSFKIAEKSGLSLPEQQELLIIQDENTRLRFLRDYFNKLNEQVEKNSAKKSIIINDGYIN